MQIRTRFFLGFVAIIIPLVLIGITSVTNTLRASEQAQDVLRRIETVQTLFQLKANVDRGVQELLSISTSVHIVADTGGEVAAAEFIANEVDELASASENVEALLATYAQLNAEVQGSTELVEDLTSAIQGLQQLGGVMLAAGESGSQEALTAALLDMEVFTDAFEEAIAAALAPELAAQTESSQLVANSAVAGTIATAGGYMVLIAIMFVVGIIFTRAVVTPTTRLREAAEALQSGNYSYRTIKIGRDEFGQVAQTFNRMAEAVQERDKSLNEINATLEKRVEERTAEVRTAMALVEESSRLKSQFLANMSHELRTPLNAIIGFTGIMIEGMAGEIDDDARHMVSRVQANSERLLDLIDGVLDLAKIEAGRIELINTAVSPQALAKRWKSETEVLAQQKNLTLDVTIDPDLPEHLQGDEDRLTQIAVNLLSNAIKFTEVGGVSLKLAQSGSSWTIEVSDTGIGIPPHAINYIFDEFRQADGSTTRMYGGTGLGLSISRRLCLMMGGNIRVSSELGKGSTFTVTLPLNRIDTKHSENLVVA